MTSVFVDTLPRLIVILVNILILVYIINLEKKNCVCSSNWKRDFIKYFTIILIVLNVFVLLVPQFKKSKNKVVLLLLGLLALVNLFNIAILLVYYVELSEKQKTGCECSVNWKRHIMLFPVLALALLYIFLLVRIMLK
tara:strand:+ start:236 stop:649 length:414 start_codon:yes stop_codon:yes gene_type:complete